MENLFIIKDRINEALQMRGMTASELAKKSGIAKSSISRYLTGENVPRSIAIEKIATALFRLLTSHFILSTFNQKKNPTA